MPRIRTIKPSFWSDSKTARLSRDARLLAVGLISFADDQGRFTASPASIIGYVFPHDEIKPASLKRWLGELESVGIVEFYDVEGIKYGWLPTWRKHQRISHPQASTFPAPPGAGDGE